jgi:integrase
LLDEWLPAISPTVRPNTVTTYRRAVKWVTASEIGGMPLRALTGGNLNALYADLERAGLSVNSRRLVHAALHRAFRDAVRWDKLARNPAASADPPALPRTRVQAWTATELRRFLDHVREDRLYALWRLGATTGMRRGELLGLPLLCLDLDGAKLRVEQQLLAAKGGTMFGPPKSRRSERTIALDPETIRVLCHHIETQRLERDLAGPAYEDHDLVFCSELGRPIGPSLLGKWFVRHRKAAGIPVGTLHVLRHTAATLALTSGVPLHVVAARLGDDPKVVLATYAHLLPHSDSEAAVTIAAAISDDSAFVDKPWTNAGALTAGIEH